MGKFSLAVAVFLSVAASSHAQSVVNIDLHTHSYCSDGLKTPEQVVRDAKAAGVAYLALTDHDTAFCVQRAREEAARLGLTLIQGIEIGAQDDSLHILGLGIDASNPAIAGQGHKIMAEHVRRARTMMASLAAHGMPLDLKLDLILPRLNRERRTDGQPPLAPEQAQAMTEEELLAQLHGPVLLPDLAQAMVARGYVPNVQEAFGRYIGDEAPNSFKIPIDALSFRAAISLIHGAGGVAILAHPYTVYKYKPFPRALGGRLYQNFDALALELLDAGLDGFEYFRPNWPSFKSDNAVIDAIVAQDRSRNPARSLLLTAGSDYHGYSRPGGVGPTSPGGLDYPATEADKLKRALNLP